MMRVLLERWSGLNWAVAGLLAGLLVSAGQLAWAAPEPQTLKGVVERFNHSPEGRYEGLLAAPTKFEAESIASETYRSVALDAP
jgi:hypothetical protein